MQSDECKYKYRSKHKLQYMHRLAVQSVHAYVEQKSIVCRNLVFSDLFRVVVRVVLWWSMVVVGVVLGPLLELFDVVFDLRQHSRNSCIKGRPVNTCQSKFSQLFFPSEEELSSTPRSAFRQNSSSSSSRSKSTSISIHISISTAFELNKRIQKENRKIRRKEI